MQYDMFIEDRRITDPYILNTRIYSYLLIRNDIPWRWRGRYNEDTDLSLNVLKNNWCTVLFKHSLAGKIKTQIKSGGNSDEFYFKEGTTNKSQQLKDMHPDCVNLVTRYGRDHHFIDYVGIFRHPLELKDEWRNCCNKYPKVNEGGQILVEIPKEWRHDPIKDTNSYILNHLNEVKIIDTTKFLLRE